MATRRTEPATEREREVIVTDSGGGGGGLGTVVGVVIGLVVVLLVAWMLFFRGAVDSATTEGGDVNVDVPSEVEIEEQGGQSGG